MLISEGDDSPAPWEASLAVSSTCFHKMSRNLISPPLIVQEAQELLQGEEALMDTDAYKHLPLETTLRATFFLSTHVL